MKVFDAEATAEALPYLRLIEEMRRLFADGLRAPDRHHHNLPMVGEADGTLLLMPVWDENVGCIRCCQTNEPRNLYSYDNLTL